MSEIDAEKLHAQFEEQNNIVEWFDEITSQPLEGEYRQLAEVGELLFRAIKGRRMVFEDDELEIATAVTRGVFFSTSICGAHFYHNNPDKSHPELLSSAIEEVEIQIENLEPSGDDDPGIWFEEINSQLTGHGIGNLMEVVSTYEDDICPNVLRQGDYRFGAYVGGYIFRIAFELEKLQEEYDMVFPEDMDSLIEDLLSEDRRTEMTD